MYCFARESGPPCIQAVGGNAALALLLTVATNMFGIVTMPFMLSALLVGDSFQLAPWPLLFALLKTILLPTLAGIGLRASVPGNMPALPDTQTFKLLPMF